MLIQVPLPQTVLPHSSISFNLALIDIIIIVLWRDFWATTYLYISHCLGCQVVVHSQENNHKFQCCYYQKKNNFRENCMDKELDFQLYHLNKTKNKTTFISHYVQTPVHIYLPMQVLPSPRNPLLQIHSKLPSVFTQFEFISQSCNPFLHSSSSISSNYSCKLNFWHRCNNYIMLYLPGQVNPLPK